MVRRVSEGNVYVSEKTIFSPYLIQISQLANVHVANAAYGLHCIGKSGNAVFMFSLTTTCAAGPSLSKMSSSFGIHEGIG